MKIIVSDLKKLCIDSFKEQDWKNVYDFYTKKLQVDCTTKNPEYNKKVGAKRNVYIPSNERRLKHLKSMISDFGADNIVKAMNNFIAKEQTGELSSLSMSYFGGFVKNVALQESKPKKTVSSTSGSTFKSVQAPVQESIIPIKMLKLPGKSAGEYGFAAWLYRCECHETFEFKQHIKCPKCGKNINWDGLAKDF